MWLLQTAPGYTAREKTTAERRGAALPGRRSVGGVRVMYSIADRQELTKRDMISLTVEAPQIARKTVPGQFVVVRVNETGERVPLTVAYKDVAAGTITIIFQVVGKSTAMLASLCARERPGAA